MRLIVASAGRGQFLREIRVARRLRYRDDNYEMVDRTMRYCIRPANIYIYIDTARTCGVGGFDFDRRVSP